MFSIYIIMHLNFIINVPANALHFAMQSISRHITHHKVGHVSYIAYAYQQFCDSFGHGDAIQND